MLGNPDVANWSAGTPVKRTAPPLPISEYAMNFRVCRCCREPMGGEAMLYP